MATLTFSMSGSSVVNGTKTYTVSDADVQRILNYVTAAYSPVGGPALSPQQALLAWVQNQCINPTSERVVSYELDQQVRTIVITPPVFT
jgi:hypothetical protein